VYLGPEDNITNQWYVHYSFLNPSTGKFARLKVYEDLNDFKEFEERERYAKEMVDEINKLLKAGYNPFESDMAADSIINEVSAKILPEENPKSPT
jgi:hypothetical protein